MEKKLTHKSLHTMLIDNDSCVRDSLKVFFETSQIAFLIFKSGSEGLNSLKYQNVDVVISDYFLPDMNGIEFLSQVAQNHPHVTRILMATLVSDEMKADMARVGIYQFIEKPLTVNALETIMNELKTLKSSCPGEGKFHE